MIWRIDEFRKLCITLNRCLINGDNLIINLKVCVVLNFEPLGVSCEMTVMPLGRILGRERVVSEQ